MRKNGIEIIIAITIAVALALGFVVGRYGKAAPSLEVAEGGKVTTTVNTVKNDVLPSSIAKVETASETPAPEYTEITVTATAYCACAKCCGKSDGITATGTKATAGRTIAVDPSVIPYGTKVKINGNTYIAEDCGGAVKGNGIDIFFNTHEEALNFGRQKLTAYILK